MLAKADLLILLTSVDGLLDEHSKTVPVVADIDEASKLARDEKGRFSVGGMASKLQAVKLATDTGIRTYVVSGRIAGRLIDAAARKRVGTRFIAKGESV